MQRHKEIRAVVDLVAQVRTRLDNGHYDFMSWNGRTRLGTKLSEYESYAKEPHRAGLATDPNNQKRTLKKMETELRALLGSTY